MSKKKTHEQFIKELTDINPYVEVLGEYESAIIKIPVRCKICGKKWETKPSLLLLGRGCPDCGKKKISNALKKTNEQFIDELGAINTNIKPLEEYKGFNEKISFQCKICGFVWQTTPHSIFSGHGCHRCGYEKQKRIQRMTDEEFYNKLSCVNPDIVVLDKYVNNHTRITFQCKKCGKKWKTVPNSVLLGHGCPECSRSSTSFFEQVLLNAFRFSYGEDEVLSRDRKTIGRELDIVIPRLKLAYEPGSWAWHYNKLKRDNIKREKCKEIGYRLITIYSDYKEDTPPFNEDCYVWTSSLGNSDWDEVKKAASMIMSENHISLSESEWDRVRKVAIERSSRRSTEEFIVELKQVNPNIILLSDYADGSTKVRVQCLKCNNIWNTKPSILLSGSGCPKCGRERIDAAHRKTHEEFIRDIKYINPSVMVLGKYQGNKTRIKCRCNTCGNIWETIPQSLMKGTGCPKCGNKKAAHKNSKTQEEFVQELSAKNPFITVIGKYVNTSTKISVKCNICEYQWNANPSDILGGHGCPKCSKSIKRTHEQFVIEMQDLFPNIEIMEKYKSANEKILVKCNICGYEWKSRPHDLLRSKGCPECWKHNK